MSLLWPIIGQALRQPRATAVIDDQGTCTYGKLLGAAMFIADHLESTVAARNVGIMLPTSSAFPMTLLGTWLAGKVAVPINYLLARDERDYVIADSGIDTIVTVGPMLDFLGGPEALPPGIKLLRLDEMAFKGFPPLRWPPFTQPSDLAVLIYTSGTSGKPKGVMLSHGNLKFDVEASIKHAQITSADSFLGVLPQFHSFGLTALTLIPLVIGSRVIYTARFVPRKIVDLIKKHQPDIMLAVPSMYGAMLSVKGVEPQHFASVRMAVSGGEPLPDATYESFKLRTGVRLLEGYGLTETSPVSTWCTHYNRRRGSVGTALPGVELRIVDEHDKPLPCNCDGEVLIGGRHVMLGYYHLDDKTAEVMVDLPCEDGGKPKRFFRSGDIGRLDDDGFLFITGRKKEMLIIGGENVFPREIEEVLAKHPSIKDAAIIGKADGMRGEVPIAFVELAEGAELDANALRAWCRESLAGYKVPKEIHAVDELPRSPTGKVLRRKLNEVSQPQK